MPVIAARSPGDAFECAIEACRIAVQYMTPVMLLTDGYIANAAEPWKVPDPDSFDAVPGHFLEEKPNADGSERCCPTSATRRARARGSSPARRA